MAFQAMRLRAEGIRKSFGRGPQSQCVLDGVSLEVRPGEFVCLLGPSGSGKSTLMKILGGIQAADGGELTVDGHPCGPRIPRSDLAHFGFIFQSDNLLPWLSVEENVLFPLDTMSLPDSRDRKERRVYAVEMLSMVGLSDYGRAYPHELSGGMRQRVGIARALVHDPSILLMDQPLGALDAITRRKLSFELLRIWSETHKSVVMVTNNVEEALLLANRICVLSSQPATVLHEVSVPIPTEERNTAIVRNPEYNRLRILIEGWLRERTERLGRAQ